MSFLNAIPLERAIFLAFSLGSIPKVSQPLFFAVTKKSPVPAPISKSLPFLVWLALIILILSLSAFCFTT